jgi:hypothetical protein
MAEDDLVKRFKPPWRILRLARSGHYKIVAAEGREVCYIYVRGNQLLNYALPDDGEAQIIAKAIARLSLEGQDQ